MEKIRNWTSLKKAPFLIDHTECSSVGHNTKFCDSAGAWGAPTPKFRRRVFIQNRENIGVAPIAPLNSVSRVETLRHGKKSEELLLKRVTINNDFYHP